MARITRLPCVCLLIASALLSAGCGPVDHNHNEHREVVSEIGIVRGPCYGRCPGYSATFKGDGSVLYRRMFYVDRVGELRGHIPTAKFVALARFILDSDYLRLPDNFTRPVTDQETVITTIVVDGKRRSVSDYGRAAPSTVWAVEQLIDNLLLQTTWETATSQAAPTTQPDPQRLLRQGMTVRQAMTALGVPPDWAEIPLVGSTMSQSGFIVSPSAYAQNTVALTFAFAGRAYELLAWSVEPLHIAFPTTSTDDHVVTPTTQPDPKGLLHIGMTESEVMKALGMPALPGIPLAGSMMSQGGTVFSPPAYPHCLVYLNFSDRGGHRFELLLDSWSVEPLPP